MESVISIRCLDPQNADALAKWDRCVESSAQGACFFRSGWVVGLNRFLSQHNCLLGFYDNDKLLGGLVLSRFSRWGVRGARRPFATPFCHPFFHPSLAAESVKACMETLLKYLSRHYHLYTLTSSYFDSAQDYLAARSHVKAIKSTMLLDLGDLPRLWDHFQSELRNRIRKARKNGLQVQPGEDPGEFYRLYVNLFAAQGRQVGFSEDQFGQFCQASACQGVGRVFEARDPAGRLHAAALITWDARTAYYTLSASHPDLRQSGANSLLLWEIFEQFTGRVGRFDLVGMNLPHISRFKKRFRGESVEYPEISVFANPLVRLGWVAYRKLQSGGLQRLGCPGQNQARTR